MQVLRMEEKTFTQSHQELEERLEEITETNGPFPGAHTPPSPKITKIVKNFQESVKEQTQNRPNN